MVSLGSAIFAFPAAGTFKSVEEAQDKICPSHKVYKPEASEKAAYDQLYPLYRDLYFSLGKSHAFFGKVLPELIRLADTVNKSDAENA